MNYETDSIDTSRFLYPVALNVAGRRCVVVGGGTVGGRRAEGLANAGAKVVIVSPVLGPTADALVAERRASHVSTSFAPELLDGTFLVVAATDSAAVNAEIDRVASARNVLVNLAAPGEGAETGDFVTMAAVRRGDLLLAVTCGGSSPGLTGLLRRELEERYGDDWGALVGLLGAVRATALETIEDSALRGIVLRRVVARADTLLALIREGKLEEAETEAIACLRS